MSSYVEMQQSRQVALDPAWPGLDAPSGVEVDPEALVSFAGVLGAEVGSGSRVSTQVLEQQLLLGSCAPFGGWETGEWMEYGLKVAGGAVARYYELVLEQAGAASVLFMEMAGGYRELDEVGRDGIAAAWDQVAVPPDPARSAGPVAGSFRESTFVERVNIFEDVEVYDSGWIEREISRLEQLQTWRPVSEVGGSLDRVATHLGEVAGLIRDRARVLAQQWSSPTSVACQGALRRIVGTAEEVAEAARRSSEFAFESAGVLQRAVQGGGFEDGRGLLAKGGDLFREGKPSLDRQFQEELALLNESYRALSLTLPPYVNADLPELPKTEGFVGGGEGSSGGGAGSGRGYTPPVPPSGRSAAVVAGGGPGLGGVPEPVSGLQSGSGSVLGPGELGPGSGFAGGGVPGEGERPVGGLAGAGAGGGVPSGVSGGLGTGGAGVGPGAGAGAGGPGVGPGAGVGGVGPAGAGSAGRGAAGAGGAGRGGVGMVPTGAGGSGGSAGGGSRGGGGAGRAGAAGMAPMGGPGRGGEEEQRKGSEAWLVEDEDPWRGEDDGVPPPVIK